MGLSFNAAEARKADSFSAIIKETGKYEGVITRAEKLVSQAGTKGVGISFKTDDGATANYLDVYTEKANGEQLWGANIVQAILGCLKIKDAPDGMVTFDEWNKDEKRMVSVTMPGYPALMGKRIGFLLQRVLDTNPNTGADTDRVNIVSVFQAGTGLTSSEILDGKTKPEKTEQRLKALTPVWDKRKNKTAAPVPAPSNEAPPFDFDTEIKF